MKGPRADGATVATLGPRCAREPPRARYSAQPDAMFISDFATRRPIITVVTMIALVVFGIAALARLQTDEFPDIDAPIVFIGIAYPGASPDQVEREVVDRIEDRIAGISGLDQLHSASTD